MWVYWKHFNSQQWLRVCACAWACVCVCLGLCDKSGSILWSATEASVIGQAMSLLVLKGFFAQQRGHPRVILPFAGGEIPQDSPRSSSLTKLLTLFGRHMFQLSNLWLFSIISTYIYYQHLLSPPTNSYLRCHLQRRSPARATGYKTRTLLGSQTSIPNKRHDISIHCCYVFFIVTKL